MTEHSEASLPERPSFLVVVFLAPAIWALHFLLSYVTAAIWCARYAGTEGSLGPVHVAIAVYTVAALVAIVFIGRHGYRRHSHGTETAPHDSDTPEDRHRFLGFATMLLAGLSAVATVFIAFAVYVMGKCY